MNAVTAVVPSWVTAIVNRVHADLQERSDEDWKTFAGGMLGWTAASLLDRGVTKEQIVQIVVMSIDHYRALHGDLRKGE